MVNKNLGPLGTKVDLRGDGDAPIRIVIILDII